MKFWVRTFVSGFHCERRCLIIHLFTQQKELNKTFSGFPSLLPAALTTGRLQHSDVLSVRLLKGSKSGEVTSVLSFKELLGAVHDDVL